MAWPKEYGGRGATLIEQAIFNEEVVRARTPTVANVLGLAMGGPTVIAHGTEEQKQRYLPPILSAEEIWCQGFSEPESGSDLASLKTRAVRDGDEWVVTGQKVWTTFAHHAKWCMLVARTDTDAPKHKGLTYFLMDMEQDAVQVRPLRADHRRGRVQRAVHRGGADPPREHRRRRGQRLDGRDHDADARARHARVRPAGAVQIALRELLEHGARDAREQRPAATEDPVIRQRLAQLMIESEVLRLNAYRGLTAIMRSGVPGPEGSLGKWHWSEVNQSLTELAMDIAGPHAMRAESELGVPVPAGAGELDRGRDDRDPQEHRRRARPRSAADAMNFELTDDQQAIKRTANEFLAARYKLETVRELAEGERGFTDEQWRELAELGWPGVIVPEEDGGLGLGAVELVVIQEEMGYALAPSPLFSTVAAALLLVAAGTDEQRSVARAAGDRRGRGTVAVWDETRAGRPTTPRSSLGRLAVRDEGGGSGGGHRRLRDRRRRGREALPGRDQARESRSSSRNRSTRRASCSGSSSTGRRRSRSDRAATGSRTRTRRSSRARRRERRRRLSARWRWRSSTPRTASSSTARSGPTRPCRTVVRRCCSR